jgi:hypothetical protein
VGPYVFFFILLNPWSTFFWQVNVFNGNGSHILVISFHQETPDEKLAVSDSESGDFSSWQGNRGIARRRTSVRRTSKPED